MEIKQPMRTQSAIIIENTREWRIVDRGCLSHVVGSGGRLLTDEGRIIFLQADLPPRCTRNKSISSQAQRFHGMCPRTLCNLQLAVSDSPGKAFSFTTQSYNYWCVYWNGSCCRVDRCNWKRDLETLKAEDYLTVYSSVWAPEPPGSGADILATRLFQGIRLSLVKIACCYISGNRV